MSIKLDNTKAYLKSYSKRLIRLLKKSLDNKKITYTGAAKNSLRQNIVEDSLDAFGIEIVTALQPEITGEMPVRAFCLQGFEHPAHRGPAQGIDLRITDQFELLTDQ